MKNKKIMIVKIDWSKQKVLNDERLDLIVSDFIARNVDFELVLIDAENYIIDSNINVIVNKYIADCKKEKKPLAVKYNNISLFIVNTMKHNAAAGWFIKPDEKDVSFKVIAPDGKSFCVDIPKRYISDDRYQDLMNLGPDYIEGGLSTDVIFNYVLAPFYWFLYKCDLLNAEDYNDLCNYKFGLN